MTVPSPARVLCFGEALVDRLGPPGGDPAHDIPVDDRLGGAPANVACALARLGTGAALIGRLGDDRIGAAFRALLLERGVDTRALQCDPLRPSRTVLVRRDAAGERHFGGFAGDRGEGFADQAIDAAAMAGVLAPLLAQARWLLCGTIPLASAAAAAALQELLLAAGAHGLPLALDVNWRPTFWGLGAEQGPPPAVRQRLEPLLTQAALFKCSREEALWLFGSANATVVRRALPQRPAVLITDGPEPIDWAVGACGGRLPSLPVAAIDTTGAGDAFLAGLLHQLVGRPGLLQEPVVVSAVEQVLRFAAACGALVCQGAGAIDPQPSEQQVLAVLGESAAGTGAL
nr:carbohydrate kinase [Synechococcus sp. MW101C3]